MTIWKTNNTINYFEINSDSDFMINFLFVGNNHRQIIKYFLNYLLHLQLVEIRNTKAKLMKFDQLSEILKITNERLYSNAIKAVNINLTLRNWIFGF